MGTSATGTVNVAPTMVEYTVSRELWQGDREAELAHLGPHIWEGLANGHGVAPSVLKGTHVLILRGVDEVEMNPALLKVWFHLVRGQAIP